MFSIGNTCNIYAIDAITRRDTYLSADFTVFKINNRFFFLFSYALHQRNIKMLFDYTLEFVHNTSHNIKRQRNSRR